MATVPQGSVEIKIDGLWSIDKANAVCNLLDFSGAVDLFQNA